jgi:hypothetical protein
MTWRPAGYLAYYTSEDRAQLHAGWPGPPLRNTAQPQITEDGTFKYLILIEANDFVYNNLTNRMGFTIRRSYLFQRNI